MNQDWTLVIDICILSVLLGIATFIKRKVKFFRRFLIPNSIIAGLLGLIAGPEIFNLYNFSSHRLETIVYHLMAVGFIALALKERTRDRSSEITNTGMFIVSTYIIQGILGFGITLLLAYTIMPELFPSFGLLLPLGFGQGPGQASSIGGSWEVISGKTGLINGANIGLSIAAIGFLWACIGGVPYINYLVKKSRKKIEQYDENSAAKNMIHEEDRPDEVPLSESIDRITIQIFLIGIVYLLTYLLIYGLSSILSKYGTFGETFANMLWGFHFIVGSLIALIARRIFDGFKKTKFMSRNYPNNFLLQRIAGGSFDFMVTAGICAISIKVLKAYFLPTIIITTLGMIITAVYVHYISKKIYENHIIESTAALYGMLTGTISTGLALLREVDPNFKTPVSKQLVLGSGVGLFFGLPLMLLISLPITGFSMEKPIYYLYTMIGLILYLGLLYILMYFNNKRAKRK